MRKGAFPEILLSPQVLINCRGGGDCQGGEPGGVYEYMRYYGLPDETCQAYEAVNGKCNALGVCRTCDWTSPKQVGYVGYVGWSKNSLREVCS